MNSFLQQTAQSIIKTIEWKQLNRTTLVLPSHRAGLVLKNELLRLQQEHHAQAIWAPQVRTLTQLQDELSPLYAEDELFTIIRLYKLYLASFNYQYSNDPMPLDMFYGWGRQMLADFTNVDASMPPSEVPNFFEHTIAAHELEQWKLDPETEQRLRSLLSDNTGLEAGIHENSIRAQYELLWQQLYELYKALNEEMTAEKKGYAGMRQRAVLNEWEDESIQSKIAGRIYIFVGFNYLLPVERELMMRLKNNGQALFYWDYVKDFKTNRKAFSFAERNSELLPNMLPPRLWKDTRSMTVITCVSHEAQAQYVHKWLKDNYTQKGQKVGVVICDETMLEPVIYTLPPIVLEGESEPEPINITKGFPLRNTAVYARALAWLGDKARGKAEDVVSPDIINQMLEALFPKIQQGTDDKVTLERPVEQEGLKWQELLILESEYQLRKIANQMRLLIANGLGDLPFTLKLLRLLMRRMMENVTMPFHGEPVTDIQVMGVLETRLLDFDKLLLLNVEEGIIPQQHTDISFIPFYLRKTYHMQTSDERATVYAYNFFRLLSRAGNATLLYADADTAEGGKGMSRFIMQMLYSPDFEVTSYRLPEQSILAKIDEERLGTSGVSMRSRLVVGGDGMIRWPGGKEYVLSPSALNTYIDCPRWFCFRYIQGLKEPEKEETQFEQNTLGSFVHHTIEYIYKECLGCDNTKPVFVSPERIRAINTTENRELALKDAYRLMNEEWREQHPDENEHYIIAEHAHKENIIIDGYVQNILERDEKDAADGLQICLLEAERYFHLPIEGMGTLTMGGKIDRLDICGVEGQEKLRVIDYKTGNYKSDKLSASMDSLFENKKKSYVRQTLLYCHAVAEHERQNNQKCLPVEPNLFFCRHKLTDIKTNLSVDKKPISDYAEIKDVFVEALSGKVKELLTTTTFPPCEEKDCKPYCPFLDYCGRKVMEFDI